MNLAAAKAKANELVTRVADEIQSPLQTASGAESRRDLLYELVTAEEGIEAMLAVVKAFRRRVQIVSNESDDE